MTTAPDASPNQSRRPARACSAAALVLLFSSLPLAAQTPAERPPEQVETPAEQDPSAADTPDLPSATTADTADAAPTEPEDPFDYEASEQISEDLSVSFPVDI